MCQKMAYQCLADSSTDPCEGTSCETKPDTLFGEFHAATVGPCRVSAQDAATTEQWSVQNLWQEAQTLLLEPDHIDNILEKTIEDILDNR